MSRVIRYRAWNHKESEMIDWFPEFFSDMSKVTAWSSEIDFEGNVLMQFTGLSDKNGVSVFEGDIIQNKLGRVCKVVWFNSAGCWDSEFLYDTDTDSKHELSDGFATSRWWANVEVIGNIYQDSNLLK